MDSSKFEQARLLYDEGDFRSAAAGFVAAVDPTTTVGNGPAYHLGGNSLLKIKRYADAIKMFEMALADEAYGKRSALQLNIAAAYLQNGDYSDAVRHYETAIQEPDCSAPYRAYNGMGKALMKQKRYEESAVAYRRATLDEANPDPGRSLVQLGVCLAAVGKPEDAIAAYQGALSIPSFTNQGLALVNLGFASHALHRWAEAIRSFDEARERYGATLSPDAETALAQARAAIGVMTPDLPAAEPELAAKAMPADLTAEDATIAAPTDIIPTADQEVPVAEQAIAEPLPPVLQTAPAPLVTIDPVIAETTTGSMPALDGEAVDQYFQMSEKEAKRKGRELARASRPKFAWVRWVVSIAVIVAVVAGSVFAVWYTGFGIPSSTEAVIKLMDAYNSGKPLEGLWVSGSTNITREMAQIPALSEYSVGEASVSGMSGDVLTTVTPATGEPIEFRFGVAREGIGWKVSSVEAQY